MLGLDVVDAATVACTQMCLGGAVCSLRREGFPLPRPADSPVPDGAAPFALRLCSKIADAGPDEAEAGLKGAERASGTLARPSAPQAPSSASPVPHHEGGGASATPRRMKQ